MNYLMQRIACRFGWHWMDTVYGQPIEYEEFFEVSGESCRNRIQSRSRVCRHCGLRNAITFIPA